MGHAWDHPTLLQGPRFISPKSHYVTFCPIWPIKALPTLLQGWFEFAPSFTVTYTCFDTTPGGDLLLGKWLHCAGLTCPGCHCRWMELTSQGGILYHAGRPLLGVTSTCGYDPQLPQSPPALQVSATRAARDLARSHGTQWCCRRWVQTTP